MCREFNDWFQVLYRIVQDLDVTFREMTELKRKSCGRNGFVVLVSRDLLILIDYWINSTIKQETARLDADDPVGHQGERRGFRPNGVVDQKKNLLNQAEASHRFIFIGCSEPVSRLWPSLVRRSFTAFRRYSRWNGLMEFIVLNWRKCD
jgi:hypothetical protein